MIDADSYTSRQQDVRGLRIDAKDWIQYHEQPRCLDIRVEARSLGGKIMSDAKSIMCDGHMDEQWGASVFDYM